MEKDKIISIIQKVLAKTNNNNNENEVETALLKAQELMAKYNLSMSDVNVEEKKEKEVSDEAVTGFAKTEWWVKILSVIIGENFRCTPVIHTLKGRTRLNYIGLKEDVEIAKEVLEYAIIAVKHLSKNYVISFVNKTNLIPFEKRPSHLRKFLTLKDVKGEKNDYINGFLKGLKAKFQEQVDKNNWGLVLVKDDAIVEYEKNKKFGKSTVNRNQSTSRDRNPEHFQKGYKDGQSFNFNSKAIND